MKKESENICFGSLDEEIGWWKISASVRQNYRLKRRDDFKQYLGDWKTLKGLEVGALDFPIFGKEESDIFFADFYSYEQLIEKYKDSSIFNPAEIVRPEFVVPELDYYDQIQQSFDYIVACHVMEHLPNPFGFLKSVMARLKGGGALFLTIPDKRFIQEDCRRETTPFPHLLTDFEENPKALSFDHYVDFVWGIESEPRADLQGLIEKAKGLFDSGTFDIHSHIWTDFSFKYQIEYLQKQWDPKFEILLCSSTPYPAGYNEFTVILRKL